MKTQNKYVRYLLMAGIMLICFGVNCGGRYIAEKCCLPGWFDSYGTFLTAYAFGPVAGAIIGVASNIAFSFTDISSAAYGIVSIFIGVCVGYFAKKKYFDTFYKTMSVVGVITAGTVVLSSILNLILYSGGTNNIWGDGVIGYLTENGVNRIVSEFIGELYVEFPDKLMCTIFLFLMIRFVRWLKKRKKEDIAKGTAALSAMLVISGFLLPAKDLCSHAENEGNIEHISYIQDIFNSENGLLCGHANAIAQTSDGMLWVGTYAGLYSYNGSEFSRISNIDDIRNVNCIFVDKKDRLWIGTNDNGLVIVTKERIITVINSSEGMPSDSIRSIVESSDGDMYIGTSDGMAIVGTENEFPIKNVMRDAGYVGHITADSCGDIAAVNSEGELFIMKNDHVINRLDKTYEGLKFTSCNFGNDDVLYIGTTDGIFCEYSIDNGKLVKKRETKCDGVTKINNIYPDIAGYKWICADNGIGYIDGSMRYSAQETGEFNHSIESMIIDYQGNLWFASSRLGLLQLSRSSVTDIFADCGLKPSVVNSTALYEGLLYAGSDDGLKIIDMNKHDTVENDLTQLLEGKRIRCIKSDSKDRLWICSYDLGLVMVDGDDITLLSDEIKSIGDRARTCCELSDGTMAVSSSNGLFFIKDDSLSGSIPYGDEFGYAQVLCIHETPDGTIYAGTDGNGIAVIHNGKFVKRITRGNGLTSEVILRMTADRDGNIFVVTSNSICTMKDDMVQVIDSFPYYNNYDIVFDDDGEMFVPGSAGVYVLDEKELLSGAEPEHKLLNFHSGLVCSLTANAWNYVDDKNNLYLSADRGVYKVNLDSYLLKQSLFHIKISEVKLDDKQISLIDEHDIKIKRSVSKLQLVPEIINFSRDEPIISYRLEGFDSGWKNVAQNDLHSLTYTNLEPGDYIFRIAVRAEDGSIIEEKVYTIQKEMAIYDHTWFRGYMIGIGVLFIGWLTWFLTSIRMQRRIKLQEAELALARQQVQMGNETILAIAKTVDAKDERTSKHSQRVSEYSKLIAKEYGFTEKEQENIRNAALLHDIGKIGIPDSVLNKPGRLTDEEYTMMKTHVTRGAEILKDFTLIDHVVEGARYHHERYDGKGYPDHLAGEEIPLYGRIISIADAFDAMTANRVYRKRQDFDYVMGELQKGRGTQFDPELLDIFLKLIDEKKIDIDAIYANAPTAPEENSGDLKPKSVEEAKK